MDIENCNIPYAICMPCADEHDPMDELCDSMNDCSIDNSQITIYISSILEKLTKEMNYEKKYDAESGLYYLDITPPLWFNSLDEKYKKILIKLIEPVLQDFMKN